MFNLCWFISNTHEMEWILTTGRLMSQVAKLLSPVYLKHRWSHPFVFEPIVGIYIVLIFTFYFLKFISVFFLVLELNIGVCFSKNASNLWIRCARVCLVLRMEIVMLLAFFLASCMVPWSLYVCCRFSHLAITIVIHGNNKLNLVAYSVIVILSLSYRKISHPIFRRYLT